MPSAELKEIQRARWDAGPFERIEATIADMHEATVERLSANTGERWLDVGCGTGGIALIAARAGARATGLDLAPVLIETARARAAAEGLEVTLEVGDAENLPYEDASFDVVSSTVGAMFALDPEAVARELTRVTVSGGRLGFTAWEPDSGAADYFRLMAPFRPPPGGVSNPFDWGRRDVVERLLGDAFELEFEVLDSPFRPDSGEEAWELFSTCFGPLKRLVDSLDLARKAELERSWVDYHEALRDGDGIAQSRTYLFALGRRR